MRLITKFIKKKCFLQVIPIGIVPIYLFLIYGIAKYMSIYVEIDMCMTSKARVVEKKDV